MHNTDYEQAVAYERRFIRREQLGRLENNHAERKHAWRVYKCPDTGRWNITQLLTDNGQNTITWSRDTHAEALTYADKMVRTREVVLPRPDDHGYISTDDKQVSREGTWLEHTANTAAWIEEPGLIGVIIGDGDYYTTPDGARSIGLALLALAEKETDNA